MVEQTAIQHHFDWGRTPIIYLPSFDGSGWTSVPEHQDPWERAIALGGLDYPDGWRDKEAWGKFQRIVLNSMRFYLDQDFGWWGPRFNVWGPCGGRWYVCDQLKGKNAALGSEQGGYRTVEEAQEAAQDLQENREENLAYWPF